MGYLPDQTIRDCVAQVERANVTIGELVAGLRGKAPALAAAATSVLGVFLALNDHPEPALLREWLLDLRLSLKLRGWPEHDLMVIMHAIERARHAGPWTTLSEAEQLYQNALAVELERAMSELDALRHPFNHSAKAADIDRLSARIKHIQGEQGKGRPPQNGDRLKGRYELDAPIGRGGFSFVWLALDRKKHEYVAVKILRGELRDDKNIRERFFAGAERMQQEALHNAGVVNVLETSGEDGPYRYFVMEHVRGGTLEQLVTQNPNGARRKAENILLATCELVAQLHARDCLHLDIKPSNILLDDQLRPRLTDFEHVHRIHDASATHQGRPHVSPHYSAPELVSGGAARRASDVFSLARVALFIELGKPLDQSVEASDFIDNQRISTALAAVLRKATNPAAGLRYVDAGSLRDALSGAFSDPGDFDRWIEALVAPGAITLDGIEASKGIFELLCTLKDTAELQHLLEYLGYEPVLFGDDEPLVDAAFDVAKYVHDQREVLYFWYRLLGRGARVGRPAADGSHAAATAAMRLESLVVDAIAPDLLRFLALVVLPGPGAAQLPQSSRAPPREFVAQTLLVLDLAQALPRLVALLATMRPALVSRLQEITGGPLVRLEMDLPLWSIWQTIPEVNPAAYLRERLPAHAHGFLAPAWSDVRMRREGAILLYRHRLGHSPQPLEQLPDSANESLSMLLALMFDDAELRVLAAYFGSVITIHLPGASAPVLAESFVLAVPPELRPPVFALLLQRRPRWTAELLATAEKFGLSEEACRAAELASPSSGWRFGELLFSVVSEGRVGLEQIGVRVKEIVGLMAAPRLRAQAAAEWLMKQGLVDDVFWARLRELVPLRSREFAELEAPGIYWWGG